MRNSTKDRTVMFVSAAIAAIFILVSIDFPDAINRGVNWLFSAITINFG